MYVLRAQMQLSHRYSTFESSTDSWPTTLYLILNQSKRQSPRRRCEGASCNMGLFCVSENMAEGRYSAMEVFNFNSHLIWISYVYLRHWLIILMFMQTQHIILLILVIVFNIKFHKIYFSFVLRCMTSHLNVLTIICHTCGNHQGFRWWAKHLCERQLFGTIRKFTFKQISSAPKILVTCINVAYAYV